MLAETDKLGVRLAATDGVGVSDLVTLADAPADKEAVGDGVDDGVADGVAVTVADGEGVRDKDAGTVMNLRASTLTVPGPLG
jgi:hypothetical protein